MLWMCLANGIATGFQITHCDMSNFFREWELLDVFRQWFEWKILGIFLSPGINWNSPFLPIHLELQGIIPGFYCKFYYYLRESHVRASKDFLYALIVILLSSRYKVHPQNVCIGGIASWTCKMAMSRSQRCLTNPFMMSKESYS
jgi:hypothetical protein